MVPQVQVWINNDDPTNVDKLTKSLDEAILVNKNARFMAFVIFVTDGGKLIEPLLTSIEARTGAHNIALAYLGTKNYGVSDYKVNLAPEVKNTIMVYRDKRIVAKEVNLLADDKGLATLKADIAKITK
ncbi:MAG: hypothetical protein ACHQ50_04965 [Fimbriimonadales bacterium]